MYTRRFMLYLLAVFLSSILLVVFLQYNSAQNIDKLIERNEELLAELKISKEFRSAKDERLIKLIASADQNAREAKKGGFILAAITVIASVFIFWYITNRIRLQHQLIRQLNESEQLVRQAAAAKENFMANMSHEIRTPMNAILGFTRLLTRQPLDTKSKLFVGSIQHSGESLLTIINDILDFSKIEAGMMRIESSPFNLRGLLHSVETMFTEKVQAKKIDFTISTDPSVPDVLIGDAVRLTQILVNLVNNAVKFTASGSISIIISPEKYDEERIYISFAVKDTGIGIDPEKVDRIFQRFQQGDEDTTRKYGGTGLGLTIVKQLVELQQGSISVISKQNQGAAFQCIIPYGISKEALWENNGHRSQETNHPLVSLYDEKILVAEDNTMNQSLIMHLLNNRHLNFDIVDNGEAAVAAMKENKYGLVLMDIQMPKLDGYKTTQFIRSELKDNTPIVAMTAHAISGEKEKCLSLGMNDYISKPIVEEELFTIIYRIFNHVKCDSGRNTLRMDERFEFIDPAYLQSLSGGNKEFEKDMVSQFIEQIPTEMKNLENALIKENFAEASAIAHNMKTSVSFLGMTEKVEPLLEDIEKTAGTGPHLGKQIVQVNAICSKAVLEAEKYLQSIR